MSINRRRDPRFTVNLSATVLSYAQSGERIAFTTKNISASGLLVQSNAEFVGKVHEEYQMVLYLNKSDQDQNIHFTAEIVHQDESDHIHGMRIKKISPAEMQKLEQFINQIDELQHK
jgi:c-di-GMP-binding flagellar brake protein YcgR